MYTPSWGAAAGKRFASEETILQWEQQAMSGFTAIERQIQKTFEQSDSDLQDMNKYFEKMEKLLARERERQKREKAGAAPRPTGLDPLEEEDLEAEVDAMLGDSKPPTSKARSRLNWAVEFGHANLPNGTALPTSPSANSARKPSMDGLLPAACDEDIEAEDSDEDCSKQPELSVVEDDDSVEEDEDMQPPERPRVAEVTTRPTNSGGRPPVPSPVGSSTSG